METFVSTDGSKIKARSYKKEEDQIKYDNITTFKKFYSKMSFKKYGEIIKKDSFANYCYFEFDTSRIYFNKETLLGEQGKKYSLIFEYGLLSPTIILCKLNDLCRPQQDSMNKYIRIGDTLRVSNNYEVFDSTFLKNRYNWFGTRIQISDIQELPYLEKRHTRIFKIEQKVYWGGPINLIYFIELTNYSATKKTSFVDFIKGAELTYIKKTDIEVEI